MLKYTFFLICSMFPFMSLDATVENNNYASFSLPPAPKDNHIFPGMLIKDSQTVPHHHDPQDEIEVDFNVVV